MSALVTLKIEKLVAGGLGLARDEGGVVLVRGALPGEHVEVELRQGKGVRQGRVSRWLSESPDRVPAPDLPTADLAHARYEAQLAYKRGFVAEALRRIGKMEFAVDPTVPSPQEWHYRNAAQYLVTPQGLAYRERRSHMPLLVQDDPLVMPAIAALIQTLDPEKLDPATEIAFRGSWLSGEVVAALIGPGEPRQYLRASDHLMDAGVAGVSLAQPAEKRFGAGIRLIAGESEITEQFGDVQSRVNAIGFAQINPQAAGLAYRHAAQLAGTGDHAVDLYGGSGAIGRHVAPHFGKVTVLDIAQEALARGRQDVALAAERSGERSNIIFKQGTAARLEELGTDTIIVDPPRAGLDSHTRDAIQDSTADRLVYVSCDPATWARDTGELARQGWKLRSVTPHDFYPQTSHVEVVSLLER